MCGLLFTNRRDVGPATFARALNLIDHRGPDAEGCFAHGENDHRVLMGHKRLSIIDLDERSNQPFFSKDGRYCLIYNGEIYNHRELAAAHGLRCRTTSDTEVIVELYAKIGSSMLEHLNGMFALVIYDTKEREIFVARDRLGIKPLYLHEDEHGLIFSSEIAPIAELAGALRPDAFGIRQFLKLRMCVGGYTVFDKIRSFPAAHYAVNGKLSRYWDLPETSDTPSDDDRDAVFHDLMRDSVKIRCVADVSVGTYLSGGLDSTIVTALARPTHSWTVGFADENEFEWGRLAADHINTDHHETLIDRSEFLELHRSIVSRRHEPLSVPNEVLIYKMTRDVKRENTVVLSGEGADELFLGYDRIFRHFGAAQSFDLTEFDDHYSYGTHRDDEVISFALEPFSGINTPIAIVARFFKVAHLHGLLRRLDSSTMLCSVEARVPFVDHRIVELMAHTQLDYCLRDGVVKAPLKRAFGAHIPHEIIDRPKIGFPVPLGDIYDCDPKAGYDKFLRDGLSMIFGDEIDELITEIVYDRAKIDSAA